MNQRILTGLFFGFSLVNASHADEPNCQSQTIESHTSKICVVDKPFQHTYYILLVDGSFIFSLPDDYVESVTLIHRIPEDAAIEFPLSRQGTPTVTISGGCLPISENEEVDGNKVGIEVGRSCSFNWGNVAIVKNLQFKFKP
ncbi:hypothetical protein LJ655_13290 [Paraburkholderia sp. MMS20-SJTN17]|uniref:Uncharacterized protein n=1 Tax=Paraburkholderia translucens TaxID=2886945 RepID=A0ABS8KDL6_9BURK|nr:hypothetical protein [Paraburkholderia sp. MMS20-SJTN17]MCC8402849.1 hypothetical protein [Paraburkholderia sp. MMS20-SJTN17]